MPDPATPDAITPRTTSHRTRAGLHSWFRPAAEFSPAAGGYRLLPLRLAPLDAERYVVTNLVGEHVLMPRPELVALVEGRIPPKGELYDTLVSRHFVLPPGSDVALDLLAAKYRTRNDHSEFTGLHLFVLTLRCDHTCPYCQVSRVSSDRAAFDMTQDTADRAIDLVFGSPSVNLKIEFQGGEPLLNFSLLRYVVERTEAQNAREGRLLQYVVTTNLANLTEEHLGFFRDHAVQVSTSLDGPRELHNANRPRPGGDAYGRTIEGIHRCREALGQDAVAALMTTTRRSLEQPEAIVDEYVAQGFRSVFLRWLSPYGHAVRSDRVVGYGVTEWSAFYERGLRRVIDLARSGHAIREEYAAIILRKMLTPFASGYVDLQSPAGLGLGAVVYNYDGDVYASDEARMLAEMGDRSLRLGTVRDSYERLFLDGRLESILDATMTEATPVCTDCAFEPFCGADPAFHRATQGDFVGHRPSSAFCERNMFVFRLLLRMLNDEPEARRILESWIQG